MKDTPSNSKPEVHDEQRKVFPVAIDNWSEEQFTVTVRSATVAETSQAMDWDNIEAVGAADDASRFRIDEPNAEAVGACP